MTDFIRRNGTIGYTSDKIHNPSGRILTERDVRTAYRDQMNSSSDDSSSRSGSEGRQFGGGYDDDE